MARSIEILSGGGRIALNEFSEKVVVNTLLALLGSLHDVDVSKEIRIVIPAKG